MKGEERKRGVERKREGKKWTMGEESECGMCVIDLIGRTERNVESQEK